MKKPGSPRTPPPLTGIEKVRHVVAVASGKSLPEAGVLVATTPQVVAIADVKRAVSLFRKTGKSILGIVENMAYFCCAHSPDRIEIFGSGGGEALSRQLGVPLLASLPINHQHRAAGRRRCRGSADVPIAGFRDGEAVRLRSRPGGPAIRGAFRGRPLGVSGP